MGHSEHNMKTVILSVILFQELLLYIWLVYNMFHNWTGACIWCIECQSMDFAILIPYIIFFHWHVSTLDHFNIISCKITEPIWLNIYSIWWKEGEGGLLNFMVFAKFHNTYRYYQIRNVTITIKIMVKFNIILFMYSLFQLLISTLLFQALVPHAKLWICHFAYMGFIISWCTVLQAPPVWNHAF